MLSAAVQGFAKVPPHVRGLDAEPSETHSTAQWGAHARGSQDIKIQAMGELQIFGP